MGVDLDDDTRHGLAAFLADLLPSLPGQVVPPDNWHLTMRFLGNLEDVQYDRLLQSLEEEIAGGPFTLSFAGLGAFPKPAKATVLWLGVDRGTDELARLADQVSTACAAIGFPPEDRPFRAHLTLARIRRPADVWHLLEYEPAPSLRMPVDRLTVFRSDLSQGRASYERRDTIDLA